MTSGDPQNIFQTLSNDVRAGTDFSTSFFLIDVVREVLRFAGGATRQNVLVELPLCFEFHEDRADVHVSWDTRETLLRVQHALRDRRVHFEALSLRSSETSSKFLEADELQNEAFAVFGFLRNDCVVCVRPHDRLNCLSVLLR